VNANERDVPAPDQPIAAASPFRAWSGQRWICLGLRLYLGGLFLLACLHKIQSPATFALDVATYQFLPLATINWFSLVVPWLELLVGLSLVLGLRVRAGAFIASLLMVAFIVALGWALAKGLDMHCGCFASQSAKEQDPISWRTLLRDASWLGIGLYVMLFDRQPIGIESLIGFGPRRSTRKQSA
jgi:uncharacterized membrane protein YphA (DoxX/SURF4 family)